VVLETEDVLARLALGVLKPSDFIGVDVEEAGEETSMFNRRLTWKVYIQFNNLLPCWLPWPCTYIWLG
jgi:hypothetical protein